MGTVQTVVQQNMVQIEHLDRVSWYQSLIQEWTGQDPQVFVQADGLVAAYVMGYHSQAGLVHVGATQVWSDSIENALDALSCQVYADLQADLARVANVAVPSGTVAAMGMVGRASRWS